MKIKAKKGTARSAEDRAALVSRGWEAIRRENWSEAHRCGAQLLEGGAGDFEGLHLCGVAAFQCGEMTRAVELLRQADRLAPGNPGLLNSLGNALREIGSLEEAVGRFRAALELSPEMAPAHLNLGMTLKRMGEIEQAMACYERALALAPTLSQAQYNLGGVLQEQNRATEAESAFRKVLRQAPCMAEAHCNLGVLLSEQLRYAEADAAYREAIRCSPTQAAAHYNLGLNLLRDGKWKEGWREYEWRWRCKELTLGLYNLPVPQWRGKRLDQGEVLLVHAEQGLGDAIQFVRYLPLLEDRAPRVILAVAAEMVSLMAEAFPRIRVVDKKGTLPEFHTHIPLLSLPHVLGGLAPEAETSPVPYVKAAPDKVSAWRARLDELVTGLKVGLVWAGSTVHVNDRQRSLGLARLQPLFELSGVGWIGLQKGGAVAQLGEVGTPVVDWSGAWKDIRDTAALIEGLDLVVAVDTMIAHLAGALGKPTWILLPVPVDWRWGHLGETTPWYPRTRLFRQPTPGDWETPIRRMRDALTALRDGVG